jgi:hypothetical protein
MRNGLLASAAVLFASIAMASAETGPPSGGQPRPDAAPGAAPGERPQGREVPPGQEKGKGQPEGLGKGGAGQQKAQEKGKDAQQGREKGKDPGELGKGGAGQQKAQEKGKDQPDAQQQGREKGKDQRTPGKEGAGQQKGKEGGQASKTGEPGSMTPQQRTRIQKTVIAKGPKVRNVDFSVTVGTVIPRTVKIVVLPAVFVTVYPQYRGRKYFVYEDQIIIVDDDYKIIAVIAV